MELLLAGKTALVTGASSGIGRGIAYALGAEGVRLAITARRRERLEEVAATIVARGGHPPVVIEQDFMSEDAPHRIAEPALAGLGSVQILVNNAGGSRAFKLQASEAQWHEAMTLNFTRQRQLTDQLLAQMLVCTGNVAKVAALDEWLRSSGSLKGSELQDAASAAGFEPSFVALAVFPDIVSTMAADPEWTAAIGEAFAKDRSGVFGSIQRLRTQAKSVGSLKSTPQQTVDSRTTSSGQEVIVIEPANPQVVYVPQYNAQTVYTQPTSTTVVVQEDDDDGAGEREELAQGQRDVAGAGREVDQQVVQVGPLGVVQEQLLEGAVGHRAAPDEGLVLLDERADGDGVDAVDVVREDLVAADARGDALDAEHGGHGRAVDVAVHEADLGAGDDHVRDRILHGL